MQQRRVLSAQRSWKTKFTSCLYVLFMLKSDINTWGSLLTMILYLKTHVFILPGKLQCLLDTLWSTEKKFWLRNSVPGCNCQAMGYMYYASYPAFCTNMMYLVLMAIQCETVKVRRTMYIVHQIVEDSAEEYYPFTPPPKPQFPPCVWVGGLHNKPCVSVYIYIYIYI